jgi:uncharacterized membrane protein
MDAGRIVAAIKTAEEQFNTPFKFRVHLTQRFFEPSPVNRAKQLFIRSVSTYSSSEASQRAILFYVNLKKRKFAIVTDSKTSAICGHAYWENYGKEFSDLLRSTYFERAIAIAILSFGQRFKDVAF